MPIRVLVSGSGRMGREVLAAISREADMEPVGCVDGLAESDSVQLADGSKLPLGRDPADAIATARPDVIVDFTNAAWTPKLAPVALDAGVRLVIGTTGLSDEFLLQLRDGCARRGIGAFVAPNFALGAVLMQHMARIGARFYDNAEIIELHHGQKADAPSGTSLATARGMLEARGRPFAYPDLGAQGLAPLPGTRGGELDGVAIHSIRLPGLVAHHEVLFGGAGETLTIRHDSTSRESFMPGVLLAVREVMTRRELIIGLDRLLGLE